MFSAVAEQMGMDYQTAVQVSSGFAGGMYLGSVCGAVTGGIMAIGLKYGGVDPKAQLEAFKRNEYPPPATVVRQFADRFRAQHRSINCPDLLGVDVSKPEIYKKLSADVSKPEALKAAKDALGGRDAKEVLAACRGFVKDAATIVSELLNDAPR